MKPYLVTYDLRKPGRDYGRLTELLAGTWKGKKLAESVWLVELNATAPVVRDFIMRVVDGNDRVAVIELTRGADWACRNAIPAGQQFLAGHVTAQQAAA